MTNHKPILKLVRHLQGQWLLSDWQVTTRWCKKMPETDETYALGHIAWDTEHRAAAISLADGLPANIVSILPPQEYTAAHEMAHLLLRGLHECFDRAVEPWSMSGKCELRAKFQEQLEQVCNALAWSVTGIRPITFGEDGQ